MGWAGCPTARYQNWSDFTTLLAPTSQDGANEIRRPFWARSCGAGGGSVAQVGQARLAAVRQAFNHLFLPSSLHSHRAPSRARRSKGLLLFVRRRWSRSRNTSQGGLLGSPFRSRGRTLFKKLQLILLVTSGCARVVRFESPVYGRNGANPHVGAALMIV